MSLHRRAFLAGAGAATALLLAGCADESVDADGNPDGQSDGTAPGGGGTETATPTVTPLLPANLDVTGLQPRPEGDRTVVQITIENVGEEPGGGTLLVMATVGGDRATREQRVEIDPGNSRTYNVSFDMPADDISDISAVDFDWESDAESGSGTGSGG